LIGKNGGKGSREGRGKEGRRRNGVKGDEWNGMMIYWDMDEDGDGWWKYLDFKKI